MSNWPRDKYTGPGGGLYTGPGGGLYTGPGGGLYTGPTHDHYKSNWPPIPVLIKELRKRNMHYYADLIEEKYNLK